MNEQDYATIEASKRLYDAGIVLETEAKWTYRKEYGWKLIYTERIKGYEKFYKTIIPASSMAEVWRELPKTHLTKNLGNTPLIMMADEEDGTVVVGYGPIMFCQIVNTNPTDALIYLRIWIEEQKEAKSS